MFKHCKQRALRILKSNNITELPIPIYTIAQIIIDHNFDIIIVPGITKSCIFSQTLFVANLPAAEFRAALAHELGHILLHEFFIHSTQSETRADAFAAYFLMPPYLFEKDVLKMSVFDLSELYGIPVSLVNKRMQLIK